MEDRIMKTTGQNLGVIGFGCMGLSHAYGAAVPEEQAIDLVKEAYAIGYRFFDTAAVYTGRDREGNLSVNEVIVGKALKDVREQCVIATKYGVSHGENGLVTDGSIENLRRSLDQSLKNLQTDYIDLFYLHRIDPKVPLEEIAFEMKRQIEAGRIKGWGISEATKEDIEKVQSICPLSAIQNRYSLMARWYEPLIDYCNEQDIVFVAFSPLANGFLTTTNPNQEFNDPADFRAGMPQYSKEGSEKAAALMNELQAMAEAHHCTIAQLSLAWMTTKYPNLIPIPGSTKPERIRQNFDSSKVNLSKEEVQKLDELTDHADLPVYGGKVIEK